MKLERVLCLIDSISEWSGKIASWLMFPMVLLIALGTVLRYGFHAPNLWCGESGQMLFGALFILGGACVLRYREHVNMDIFYNRFPPRMKAIVDVVTTVFFFVVCGSLLWKGGVMGWTSLMLLERSTSVWHPPLYPLKLTMPIAAFLILLQGLAKFIRDLNAAIMGGKTIWASSK